MIYTVSFNPSLDYVQDLDCVNLGYVNRTSGEKILPGGKGINVSMVLKNRRRKPRSTDRDRRFPRMHWNCYIRS